MLLRLSFTGTSRPVSSHQLQSLRQLFRHFNTLSPRVELHHGDCINADAEAHAIAEQLQWRIVIHPPSNPKKRAYCQSPYIRPPGEYMARNRDIVNEGSTALVACPLGLQEELRSGTWAAVRYGRKCRRPIYFVWPTGKVTIEL